MAPWFDPRLKDVDISMLSAPEDHPALKPYLIENKLVVISPRFAFTHKALLAPGILGQDITLSQAQEARYFCALHVLSCLRLATAQTSQPIKQCIQLTGYVCALPGTPIGAVFDRASETMVDLLGPCGLHTRTIVGVSSLPHNASVSLGATFSLVNEDLPPLS